WLRVLCVDQDLNLTPQGCNQTCREWQVACGKWQAKESSRLSTKFRPSSTERTEVLRDLSVEALKAQRPQRTSPVRGGDTHRPYHIQTRPWGRMGRVGQIILGIMHLTQGLATSPHPRPLSRKGRGE